MIDVFVLQGLFGGSAGAPDASRHQGIHGAIAFPGLSGLPFLFPLIKAVIKWKTLGGWFRQILHQNHNDRCLMDVEEAPHLVGWRES